MGSDKDKLHQLLREIKELIDQNENEDGTFRFDMAAALVALDFAKNEIRKSISA